MKILLFAHLQEEAGTGELKMEKARATVSDVKQHLKQNYGLSQLDQAMTAVNEAYALDEDEVSANDTIAFIPPVSGG